MTATTPIERMKKILALARRGVGGEKTTAEAMLNKLLNKYGMTVADLEGGDHVAMRREFKYTTEYDRRLLRQVVAFVLDTRSFTSWKRTGKKIMLFDLTALQYAEVDIRYTAYRAQLRKELAKATDRIYLAFIHTNDLGVGSNDDVPPPGDMDLAELEAVMGLMRTMRPIPIHRQIEQEHAA